MNSIAQAKAESGKVGAASGMVSGRASGPIGLKSGSIL